MKLGEKKFLNFINKKILVITIILGATLVGFTTGNVIAQEVRLGDNSGSPFISLDDATFPGNKYEIRLNDGTGEFEIRDMTNNRTAMIIDSAGKMGVGDAGSTVQDFTIGCSEGLCNIQTRAFNGTAVNIVKSLGGSGIAKFKLADDVTSSGPMSFEIKTNDDGTLCMGTPNGLKCMLRFDLQGPNPGQVKQADGTCIANC